MSAAGIAELLVRLGIVLLFLPFSALDKVLNFDGALAQAREIFKPSTLAILVILGGLGLEIVMSLAIVTGHADRAAALVMSAYCVATAMLFKRFWAQGNFWSNSQGKGRTLFWDFLKNLSLAAGFLLITIGPDGSGLAPFLSHPLASSLPYKSYHP